MLIKTTALSTINITAEAKPHEYSVFPVLSLCKEPDMNGDYIEFAIQRANWGMPGYYVTCNLHDKAGFVSNSFITTAYLPEEFEKLHLNLREVPESLLRIIIRNYVKLALANLFSKKGWVFASETYDNGHLPTELLTEVEKFIDLEVKEIRSSISKADSLS